MVTRLRLESKPLRRASRAIRAIAEEIKPAQRRRTAEALVLLIREKLQDETRNFVEIGKMLNQARDSPELAGRSLAAGPSRRNGPCSTESRRDRLETVSDPSQ